MYNVISAWLEAASFSADVQQVITSRMLRIAAGGPLAASETRRMVAEKMAAFGEAQVAVVASLMAGNGASAASKAYAPYRKRVRANRRRLGG